MEIIEWTKLIVNTDWQSILLVLLQVSVLHHYPSSFTCHKCCIVDLTFTEYSQDAFQLNSPPNNMSTTNTTLRSDMDIQPLVDRGFLDSFVEVLPTTSDFQALFYSTGAKFAADVVAAEPTPAASPLNVSTNEETLNNASIVVAALPQHIPMVPPIHPFGVPFHPHAPPFAFLGRPLPNLEPEWQRRETPSLQKLSHHAQSDLEVSIPVLREPSLTPSILPRINVEMPPALLPTNVTAAHTLVPVKSASEYKPQTKNLSAAAKERRK